MAQTYRATGVHSCQGCMCWKDTMRRAGYLAAVVMCLVGGFGTLRAPGAELSRIAATGDPQALATALAAGADPRGADDAGWTPLHAAVTRAEPTFWQLLLAAGADVHAVNRLGETPLHIAARHARTDAIQALLAAGADPGALNAAGQTPLHVLGSAARVPDAPDFQAQLAAAGDLLVAAGADPAIIADGCPALAPAPVADDGGARDSWVVYANLGADLLAFEETYPGLCRRYDLGLSVQGRHLWALTISDNVDLEEDEPEFKYISSIHGDEIVGAKMCMLLINHLLTEYGSDPQATQIIDDVELWIVPLMNPDGYDSTPRTRYNAHGEDLNRIFPNLGEDPSPEGREPELQAIMNWSAAHTFTCSANFHGGALVVNYFFENYDSGSQYSPDDDLAIYISEQYSQHNPPMWGSSEFYHGITNGADWYVIHGCMQDWNYHFMGNNEVTIELGTSKQPSASEIPTYWNHNRDSMKAYILTCLIGVRGIVTDATTGAPLAATVVVTDRNHEIYTDPQVGDYHRMLLPGTYELRVTADGYDPAVVPGVVVSGGAATVLDVALTPAPEITFPDGGEQLALGVPVAVSWTGNPAAQFQLQVSDNYGESVVDTDDFERYALGSDYTTGGSQLWYITTAAHHGGSRAVRAGSIGHSQTTWMMRDVAGGDVSFWYRVSSETGYDFFSFYVDAERLIHASGTAGTWTYFTTNLPAGAYTLKWAYAKDSGSVGGSDTVWVDDLELNEDLTAWTDIVALTEPGAGSFLWTPAELGTEYKVRVRSYTEAGYGAWDESDALFAVVQPQFATGDLNCDGAVNAFDIDPFVLALTDPQLYDLTYPDCDAALADVSQDGAVDAFDIDPFIELLTGTP